MYTICSRRQFRYKKGRLGPAHNPPGRPPGLTRSVTTLHVEYAGRGYEYGILFMFSLFCEYIHLEYIRIRGIYRVNQAQYGIHILVVAPQEYVNIYSTRRGTTNGFTR